MRRLLPLVALCGLVIPIALMVSCPKKGGGGGGTDPCEGFPGVCLDLAGQISEAGSGALAKEATTEDLIGGVAAQGRAGDFLLQNDKIRVIVQGARRSAGIAPWGGTILDADIVRPDGEAGQDGWDELFLLINLGRTMKVDAIKVFRDGSDGGSAVLAVAGHDTLQDVVNVPYLLEGALGALGKVWADANLEMKLNITTYYILDPGASKVRIVTAFRNDGSEAYPLFIAELFARGGYAEFFNPSRVTGGRYGYPPFVPEAGDTFLAHVTPEVSYGYLPVEVFGETGLPNVVMTVSGTSAVLLGGSSLFDFTGAEVPDPLPSGAIELAPGATETLLRDFVVSRDLSGVAAAYAGLQGDALAAVSGKVTVPGGVPANTRVGVLNAGGFPVSGFAVEADGTFAGDLAAGSYKLQVDAPGFPYSPEVDLTLTAGQTATPALSVAETATVNLSVSDLAGAPIPAKVTLVCPSSCPKELLVMGRRFRESEYDGWPANVEYVGWVPVSGTLSFQVPPGEYQVVVSRGLEWSTYPADWPANAVTLTASTATPVTVDAQLAHVIDTTGWVSGDMHVHGVNSPDAPVLHLDRVASFLAEGVEVLVATDHDFLTDWAPFVEELGAKNEIFTIVGEELTTFDWGHFNAFPMVVDPDEVQGGALDWANGEGPTLSPGAMFQMVKDAPGGPEKVIQINHPRGSAGYFSSIGMDFATGKTATDPAILHMDPSIVNGDDTGLFDTAFTAIEIMNGRANASFVSRAADWMALLQRGVTRTATAVSDTHRAYSGDMGNPVTYAFVGAGKDSAATIDTQAFVQAINTGRAVGTSGPFVTFTARNLAGDTAAVGETLTLAAPGDSVALTVEVQLPTYLSIDRIELFTNTSGLDARPYGQNAALPAPDQSAVVDLSVETKVPGAGITDPSTPYLRYVITRSFTMHPTADAWVVVMVRASDPSGFPVILDEDPALAFTNALFIDADGGGYTAPSTFDSGPRRGDQGHRTPTWERAQREPTDAEKIERMRVFAHTH